MANRILQVHEVEGLTGLQFNQIEYSVIKRQRETALMGLSASMSGNTMDRHDLELAFRYFDMPIAEGGVMSDWSGGGTDDMTIDMDDHGSGDNSGFGPVPGGDDIEIEIF